MERLDGQYLFKALFVLGPAGSGKTYLIKNKLNILYSPKGKNTGNSFATETTLTEEASQRRLLQFVNDTFDPNEEAQIAKEQEKCVPVMARKVIQAGQRGHTAKLGSCRCANSFRHHRRRGRH